MKRYMGTCANNFEIILAYLWEQDTWIPAHQLDKLSTPYGHVGNSGEVRARELARNDPKCPARYHNKVERKRGSEIGLDPRFTFYRYADKKMQARKVSAAAIAWFEALPDKSITV